MNQRVKVRAEVCDGYIVVRAPTDLPNGTVLELVPEDLDGDLDEVDELDDEERAKLHAALDRGWAQAQAGLGISARELIAEFKKL